MRMLRQSARQQWILIAVLVTFIVTGGTGGFLLIRHKQPAPRPTPTFTTNDDARLRFFLDDGQYEQLAAEAARLAAAVGRHATVLRYRALAELMLGQHAEALKAADESLAVGAAGPEASVAGAVKALALLKAEVQQAGSAKEAAQRAVVQAGRDPEAGLLANVAFAAVLRGEMEKAGYRLQVTGESRRKTDDGKQATGDRQPVTRPQSSSPPLPAVTCDLSPLTYTIRQALMPLYAASTAEPRQAWLARFWRQGLAMLGETSVFAGQAKDTFAEVQTLTILQRCCPTDVWTCRFNIPERAVRAARQMQGMASNVDSHARAALYTVVGVLYESAGEPIRADAAYDWAMRAWQHAIEDTQEWGGPLTRAGEGEQARVVGAEYFAYRHCLERIAVFRANQWGARIAVGQATKEAALAACDHPLFAALVRLRADGQEQAGMILRDAGVDARYWPVLADVMERNPAGLPVDQARLCADAVRQAARQAIAEAATRPADVTSLKEKSARASQPAGPGQSYASMTDVALGVAGGRALAKAPLSEQEKLRAEAAPEPLPDFDWGQAKEKIAQAETAGQRVQSAEQPMRSVPSSQEVISNPDDPLEARVNTLYRQMMSQMDAGQADKAIDTYEQLAAVAASSTQMSDQTRQMMQMFDQSLGSLQELQDLLGELDGKPKKQAPKAQQAAPNPVQNQPQQPARQAQPMRSSPKQAVPQRVPSR